LCFSLLQSTVKKFLQNALTLTGLILSSHSSELNSITLKCIDMKALTSTLLIALIALLASCGSAKDVSQPEFRDISNVKLLNVGLLQTTAGADLVYYNPNDFGIQLANARGDVYIDNAYFGRFELDQKVQVKKRSEFILPVIFKMDNIGAIKNQKDIYKKKQAMVRIEGYALVKKAGFSKEIPIHYERMQDVDRLRGIVAR